ncbi:hypothetical protein F511_27293 [Dorcoceras hygrometricum]|uniref:Uncharacterized protein n=1 Tax=Dorcoceras hygrometricum TaxID=472368 RepID=A0A2Z7D5D4_9LAMI|nr:hypothetical protein F511_27293 [Dorcoceras hygrometricum]
MVKDKPAWIEEDKIMDVSEAGYLREMGLLWKMKMKMEMRRICENFDEIEVNLEEEEENTRAGCTRSVSIGPSWINTETDQIGRELHAIIEMSKLEHWKTSSEPSNVQEQTRARKNRTGAAVNKSRRSADQLQSSLEKKRISAQEQFREEQNR